MIGKAEADLDAFSDFEHGPSRSNSNERASNRPNCVVGSKLKG